MNIVPIDMKIVFFSKWLLFLIIFSSFSHHHCIVVITSERNERPQTDSHFIIPGLNLSSLDTFTMCGRFKINQFLLESNIVVNGTYKKITDRYRSETFQGIFPFYWISSIIDYNHDVNSNFLEKIGNHRKLEHRGIKQTSPIIQITMSFSLCLCLK